jgi:hypothetical protein
MFLSHRRTHANHVARSAGTIPPHARSLSACRFLCPFARRSPALAHRRTTLEKQLAADALTPDSLKARQLIALGRRESK